MNQDFINLNTAAMNWQAASPATRVIELKRDKRAGSFFIQCWCYDTELEIGRLCYNPEQIEQLDLRREKIAELEQQSQKLRALTELPQSTEPINP